MKNLPRDGRRKSPGEDFDFLFELLTNGDWIQRSRKRGVCTSTKALSSVKALNLNVEETQALIKCGVGAFRTVQRKRLQPYAGDRPYNASSKQFIARSRMVTN
jgi:hypothetical protein